MNPMRHSVLLHAPNVHTGGGFVLLQSLLGLAPVGGNIAALLDVRAKQQFEIPSQLRVRWVKPTVGSRFMAERSLQLASDAETTVLCFHGLPPLLPVAGQVIVFLQNRLYVQSPPWSNYSKHTALRLAIERWLGWHHRHRVARYVVQTPSMARDLAQWWCRDAKGPAQPPIDVLPFADAFAAPLPRVERPDWDFVYVADGEAHKNHRRLFDAWQVLADQGLRPRLALTLSPRDRLLGEEVQRLRAQQGLEIHDLGILPREQVFALYANARALIFPSLTESFGLPLIEASRAGLPILAPELDYVRDVCNPAQTFDPMSPTSIARAVKRFLGLAQPVVNVAPPQALWAYLQDLDEQPRAHRPNDRAAV